MRTLLICHHDAPIDREGLSRWLASFSDLAGVLVIRETRPAVRRRIRRELGRTGLLRFIDVLAFRLYYRLRLANPDMLWEQEELERLTRRFPDSQPPVLEVSHPNSNASRDFIARCQPDLVIARSKFLLKPRIFGIPRLGTFVLHPGICPQYRNAHGCFWALAQRDLGNVGLTLLKIDEGIDTGPVFGYFRYPFDEVAESHHRIQLRCLFENLDPVAATLLDIAAGRAKPVRTEGQPTAEWGQPWLTRHLRWKRIARKNACTP